MATTVGTHYIARARADAEARLVEADEIVARLQHACGGSLGTRIAIPELLALVEKAQRYGLRLARQFEAIDGENRVTAWVEIAPVTNEAGESDGCAIDVVSWHSEELPPENDIEAARRRVEINRHTADCTARLDSQQRLLSLETEASDLAEFSEQARAKVGKPWTELVDLPGTSHQQPLHWRLLDGASCSIAGSNRNWTAHLEPLGQSQPGSAGFVLYLTADRPLAKGDAEDEDEGAEGPSFGRDLTPVLRQPINRIIANAETIRTKLAGPLADEYSSYAADIATAAQHLLALIDDLSDLEVVESEDFVTAPDRIELADVARRACGILGAREGHHARRAARRGKPAGNRRIPARVADPAQSRRQCDPLFAR